MRCRSRRRPREGRRHRWTSFAGDDRRFGRAPPPSPGWGPKATEAAKPAKTEASDEAIRAQLSEALSTHHGNISHVARTMGRTRMQIHRWMKRFGINPETYRR